MIVNNTLFYYGQMLKKNYNKGNAMEETYYQRNREKILEKQKQYEKENYNSNKRHDRYIKDQKNKAQQTRVRREIFPNKVRLEQKEYYKNNKLSIKRKRREDREMFKEKYRARDILQSAIRSGKLTRPQICQKCLLSVKVQGHHKDYSKPLEVEWLCKKCHMQLHHLKII